MTIFHPLFPRRQPDASPTDARVLNWAKNTTLAEASAVTVPETEAQLQAVIVNCRGKIRIMGSRMSPGRMLAVSNPDDVLVDLSRMRGVLAVDDDSVTFAGGTPMHEVYEVLTSMNRMLNASPGVIASQTLAGALSTGTHGQGLQQSAIADDALNIRFVDGNGHLHNMDRSHPWFGAVQLGLGTLGAITAVTLRTRPSALYTCFKDAVSADTLAEDLAQLNQTWTFSKAWWFLEENKVHTWNAREANEEERSAWEQNHGDLVTLDDTRDEMNQAVDKTLQHMRNDTRIVDENGKPFRTVTRFKDFSDVIGDVYQVFCRGIATPQINIEIGVPLANAPAAIARIKAWYAKTHPHMHYPIILRCTGPSDAWLSPSWQTPTCYFGFVVYYAEDGSLSEEGLEFLRAVEPLLAEEGGKPHWGKYFDPRLYDWSACYPQWSAFQEVRQAFDPRGIFLNDFLAEVMS
jgi:FAD/FMN-containing dehydrogenase